MGKSGKTDERDRHVRAIDKASECDTHHQQRAKRKRTSPGINQTQASVFLQGGCECWPKQTAQVRGQERHPCKQRDLFKVKMTNVCQIKWQPELQRSPGEICEKAWNCNPPEVSFTQRSPDRRTRTVILKKTFLARGNVFALVVRKSGVFIW